MSGCGEGEFYALVPAELLEVDNLLWDPEASDHVRPQELSDLKVVIQLSASASFYFEK